MITAALTEKVTSRNDDFPQILFCKGVIVADTTTRLPARFVRQISR